MSRAAFASAVAFIYGLAEPDTGRIRYVGRSADPWTRYKGHLGKEASFDVRLWVAQLRKRQLAPLLVILGAVQPEDDPAAVEQEFIAGLEPAGLLNVLHVQSARRWSFRRHARVHPSKGAALFRQALAERGWNGSAAAAALGYSKIQISKWRRGLTTPNSNNAQALRDSLGIPFDAWLEWENP